MERRLFLDVVVREGATILELLAGEDQALLVRGDALLVLDLGLHRLDGVAGLDLEGDVLARQCLDENLHGCFAQIKNYLGNIKKRFLRVCLGAFLPAPSHTSPFIPSRQLDLFSPLKRAHIFGTKKEVQNGVKLLNSINA